MSKNYLAEEMSKAINVKKYQTYDFISLLIEAVIENLRQGHKVVISGFGTFFVKEKKSKRVLNPVTKAPMVIPPRKAIKFLPSKNLVKTIGGDG